MKKITILLITLFTSFSFFAQVIYINEDFNDTDISGGSVPLANGFPQYNYSADIAGGNENYTAATVAEKTNAVGVHNRSGSANFVAANASSQQALRVSGGANYSSADAGIYFTGLDLTGQSTLYFSFQILGGDNSTDSDLPATHQSWSINLNHGNSSTGFNLSDSFFGTSANVTQNISFDIDNGTSVTTDQTSFDIIDGQWITISGSVDLTGKALGSFGAFQIHTDTGGFIPGGRIIYALDNVYVANAPTLSNNSVDGLNSFINIYPNPSTDILNINANKNVNIEKITLTNILGKTIFRSKSIDAINVSNYVKGIYILKIESKNNGVLNKKVIID